MRVVRSLLSVVSKNTCGIGLTAMLLALCTSAHAQQQKKISRVGFLGNSTAKLEANLVGPFREGCASSAMLKGKI
jgi:hypothetical protein